MKDDKSRNFSINKGDVLFVKCRDIDIQGNGISVWKSMVLVTPNLIPGEKAYVKVKYRSGSRCQRCNSLVERTMGSHSQSVRWIFQKAILIQQAH